MQRLLSLFKLKYRNPPAGSGGDEVELHNTNSEAVILAEPVGGTPIVRAELLHAPPTPDDRKYCNEKTIKESNKSRESTTTRSGSNGEKKDEPIHKRTKLSAKENRSLNVSPKIIHFSMNHHDDNNSRRTASCEITLHNPSRRSTNHFVAFRVKISQLRVQGYLVRPNRGIIGPGQSERVCVTLSKKYHKKLLEMPSNIIDAINDKIVVQSFSADRDNQYVKSYLNNKKEERRCFGNNDFDLAAQVRLSNSLIGLFYDAQGNDSERFTGNHKICIKLSKRRVGERLYDLESVKHLLSNEEYQMKKQEILNSI